MIIDTHCHYNLEPLYSGQSDHFYLKPHSPLRNMNWREHWLKAQAQGVDGAIVVGTTYESSHRALEIANAVPTIFAALGIHPNHAQTEKLHERLQAGESLSEILSSQTEYLQKELTEMVQKNLDAVVAIGETGLDYFYLPTDPLEEKQEKTIQEQYFKAHLAVARENKLVPILHVRDKNVSENSASGSAYWRVLSVLQEVWPADKPFILHCVSGPQSYVARAIELGAYVGVAGNVTYKNAHALRELISSIPANRVLLETDAPYLPPQEFRGQLCEPWMIRQTGEFLQSNLGLTPTQIKENTQAIFNSRWQL